MRALLPLIAGTVLASGCFAKGEIGEPLAPPQNNPDPNNPDPNDPDPMANSCVGVARDVGRVTIHRLNRSEYNNTTRDLLLLDERPADDFPADDHGYGFDNN